MVVAAQRERASALFVADDLAATNGFALSTGFLPSPVDPRPERNNAAPSLQLHYRTFMDFSLRIGATGSHVPCKSPVQVHAAFMPDAVWAAIRTPPRLVPG